VNLREHLVEELLGSAALDADGRLPAGADSAQVAAAAEEFGADVATVALLHGMLPTVSCRGERRFARAGEGVALRVPTDSGHLVACALSRWAKEPTPELRWYPNRRIHTIGGLA